MTDARILTMDYSSFIGRKLAFDSGAGIEIDAGHPGLFDHQDALVRWALRRGRAAIFADTGLGKTRMELAWAEHIPGSVLILAPLAVAPQIRAEGTAMGIPVTLCRDGADVRPGINVTNYDRLHRFNPTDFTGVVLDESSVIKHHDARTFALLNEAFRALPYKLCATATPAPNDWTELGTHAQFLGVRTQQEMLSEFFVHDGGETQVWRLKGHARREFWRWVASWGAMVRMPSDLGFDDSRYLLPPLTVTQHTIDVDASAIGQLFAAGSLTLAERRAARRASLLDRVAACAEHVNALPDPCIVWCDLNDEDAALRRAIPDAVVIRGGDSIDDKESRLADFAAGNVRVLVSKPSICGWGLNWQHCHNIAFVGVTDSYEAYYQAIRRCWRFGQTQAVDVRVYASSTEGPVVANLQRKEREVAEMAEALSAETAETVRSVVAGYKRETNPHVTRPMTLPEFM